MHKLLSILKLALLISFTTVVLLIKNWQIISVIFILIVTTTFFLRTAKLIWQRIYTLIFISIFIIVFQLLFNWQENLITRLTLGLVNAEKIMALSLSVFIYSATTSFNELIKTLTFLPKNICLMFTISFSMLTTMLNEIQKISLTQNTRGLNTRSFNPKKSVFPIIVPLLHRSLVRSERIVLLLHARGYTN